MRKQTRARVREGKQSKAVNHIPFGVNVANKDHTHTQAGKHARTRTHTHTRTHANRYKFQASSVGEETHELD